MSVETTLAQLVLLHPAAARVLDRHRLDFCCGGKISLRTACKRVNADPDQLLAECLREQLLPGDEVDRAGRPIDWGARSSQQIVRHLLDRYHAAAREQMPRLIELAEKIERVHTRKGTADVPHGLAQQLRNAWTDLEPHFEQEEQTLFPAMLGQLPGADAKQVAQTVAKGLDDQHVAFGQTLDKIRATAHEFVAPAGACNTWRFLYLELQRFDLDMRRHVHLENNVLFPRAIAPAAAAANST